MDNGINEKPAGNTNVTNLNATSPTIQSDLLPSFGNEVFEDYHSLENCCEFYNQTEKEIVDEKGESVGSTESKPNRRLQVSETQVLDTGSYGNDKQTTEKSDDMKNETDVQFKQAALTTTRNKEDEIEHHACMACVTSFNTLEDLNLHMLEHIGQYMGGRNETNEQFEQHCEETTPNPNDHHICMVCLRSFNSLWDLNIHMLAHTGQYNNSGEKIEADEQFKPHAEETTPKPDKLRVCNVCGRSYKTLTDLNMHMLIHFGEKNFRCIICDRNFSRKENLKAHLLLHSGERDFQCNFCGKKFARASNLRDHLLLHSGEKNFQCNICDKRFSLSTYLNRHMVSHRDERNYQCDVCTKCFNAAADLKRHRVIHTGERNYKCDICSKNFARSSDLRRHTILHSGHKKFQCNVCNRKFAQSSALKQHFTMHTGEKNFHCDICDKRFSRASNLKCHMALHRDERNFPCGICEKRFARSTNLKFHMATHKNEINNQWKNCDKINTSDT